MKLQVGVKILIQNDQGDFLFIQRASAMPGEPEPHWDIPGGRINSDESLSDALAREIHEETGLELNSEPELIAAQDIFVPLKDLHVVRLTYKVKGGGTIRLSDEHQQHEWWAKSDAMTKNLDPYVRKVL